MRIGYRSDGEEARSQRGRGKTVGWHQRNAWEETASTRAKRTQRRSGPVPRQESSRSAVDLDTALSLDRGFRPLSSGMPSDIAVWTSRELWTPKRRKTEIREALNERQTDWERILNKSLDDTRLKPRSSSSDKLPAYGDKEVDYWEQWLAWAEGKNEETWMRHSLDTSLARVASDTHTA